MNAPTRHNARALREHRAALKALGRKPRTIWVPDTSTPEFKAQARRDAEALANHPDEADVMAFIASVTDWSDIPPFEEEDEKS